MAEELTSNATADFARLLESARELPSFKFREDDLPLLVETGGGELVKVPQRMAGKAARRGLSPLTGESLAQRARGARIEEEQAGIIPAIVAGTEEALSTATFGATDAAMMGLAALAGTSREDYLRAREERQEGSPIASGIGTAVGLIAPAIATGGLSGVAEAGVVGARAAARTAGRVGVGGVMEVGQLAAKKAAELGARLAPGVASAEELSAAFRAARAAGTAAPGVRAVAATALRTGAERFAAGAIEGGLWGVGEGVRETVLGKSDDLAAAVASHVGTDALLFGSLGGGLGIFESALPGVMQGARKVADRVYDAAPVFGRQALARKWAAEPFKTGVLAETAEELLAQRERLVALDERFGTVLDSLSTKSADAVRAAASHVDAIEQLAGARKGLLDTVLGAPAEVRDEILQNAGAALSFEARAKGAIEQLVGATPDRLQAAFSRGAALDVLMAGDKKALGRVLEMKSDTLAKALDNVEEIAALDAVTGGRATQTIARMQPDAAAWYIDRAGQIAELENAIPGYWQSFRAMTEGADNRFAVAQADDILNNWRLSLTNPNERSRVLRQTIEQKAAEIDAGEKLGQQLYQLSKAAEEDFLEIGAIGGPPTLEGVQAAIAGVAADAEALANKLADPVLYSPKLAKEFRQTSDAIRRDFVGVTEEEIEKGLTSDVDRYMADPRAAFERLKDQRKLLGEAIRKRESSWLSLNTLEKDSVEEMRGLYRSMSATLHDPTIFGEAATVRQMADDAFRQWKQATADGGLFDKKFRESIYNAATQQEERVLARTKVNTWLNQIGDARELASVTAELGDNATAWNAVSSSFINLVETAEKILPKAAKTTVEVDSAALQSLARRTMDATAELERRGYVTRVMNQMRLHVEGGGMNLAGLPVGLGTMGGFPHGVATAGTTGVTVLPGLGGMAPEVAAAATAAETAAAAAAGPAGAVAARGLRSLLSIPTQQRQVVARVRGMVALENMGRNLATGIEDGARWLVGRATGSKALGFEAARAVGGAPKKTRPPSARERRELEKQADEMIREANRLAGNPDALAERIEQQGGFVGRELPQTAAAVSDLMRRAAGVYARAAPVPDGQPLDKWQPSAADRASIRRVAAVVSNPLELYSRALDGTITSAEVAAVSEVMPDVVARMRAAAQAHVEAAKLDGRTISEQRRLGIETLLGYPLTRGRTAPSVQRTQGVFGAARSGRSEKPSDGMAQPLPGAAKVTLGNRYETPQQAAANR